MRIMTRITAAALAATTLLGTAGVASAHPAYDHDGRGYGPRDFARETYFRTDLVRNQLDELARRVNRNDWRDRISEREAAGLRRDVARTREQFRWMNRDGLDHRELRVLQARIDSIRFQLRGERHDRDGRRG